MQYKISYDGLSNKGLVRQNNEDYWSIDSDNQLFVLADGMGGHRAGEIASKQATEALCAFFKDKFNDSDKSLAAAVDMLGEAICDVNFFIYRMSRQHAELRGMGTTLCCVFFHPDGLVFGHVGDSRIYRLRKSHLERLTKDHSLLRELIDLGQLSEQQAEDFLYKNILTKAIGTEPSIEPTVLTDSIEIGDVILLCSDGLTDMLTDEEIRLIIQGSSGMDAVQNLIGKAIEKGGHDNVTVVMGVVQGKHESASNLS